MLFGTELPEKMPLPMAMNQIGPAAPAGFFLLWGDGGESWLPERDLSEMWERSGRWMLAFDGPPAGEGGAP